MRAEPGNEASCSELLVAPTRCARRATPRGEISQGKFYAYFGRWTLERAADEYSKTCNTLGEFIRRGKAGGNSKRDQCTIGNVQKI